ncbi:MAG: ATP synthase subunit I [Gammaproteobacteria bacterium]|nr:ATP synthase subunit I [Gammaproteobacteria bacterium]
MNSASDELRIRTRRVIGLQLGIGLAVVAGFFTIKGPAAAWSAAYGGAVGVIMSLLLSRGVMLAGRLQSAKAGQAVLYAGAAVRFVLVLVLLTVGLAALKLTPLPVVVGFIAVQLGFMLAAGRSRQEKNK